MAIAGIMEVKRKNVAKDHNMLDAIPVLQPLPISVFWLSPQYFVFGVADLFTYVGLLEFFYSQAPKSIKSISSCFLWTSMAIGYFLSSIMVQTVNKATKGMTKSRGWLAGNNINRNHLENFYYLLAILSLINFVVYLFVAKRYKYRPQSLDVEEEHKKTIVTTMASSDKAPESMPVGDGTVPPGKPMTMGHQVMDKSAQMMQTFKPIKQMSQHVCTFAMYGHDMSRQIEAHHYITRINQDFLQSAVFDSDEPSAHLIGIR
ncbi:putative proton-dependent oligopeptide transporter family protein [Tanacetum coccineum]